MLRSSAKSYIKIGIAAVLWGSLGLFGKIFEYIGFPSELTAFTRLFTGWISLVILFGIMDRSVFKIDREGLEYSAIIGFISHGLFNLCYFGAIKNTGAFTSAVLLYVSIIFMFIIGTVMYKERHSKKKIVSTLICLVGCFLGVTGGNIAGMELNFVGVIMGLLAAFFYSLMPALSKKTILKYNPFTIIIYSFMFGWLLLIPFARPWEYGALFIKPNVLLISIIFGIIVSTMPYCLYVPSLSNVQVSKLGVVCSVELIVSIPISVLLLKEQLSFGMLIGVALIIFSIVFMSFNGDS